MKKNVPTLKRSNVSTSINIFWHRRDLRLNDNAGLYQALKSEKPVLPLFIFDAHILDKLENKKDERVQFIHNHLCKIHQQLKKLGSSILIKYGKPEEVWKDLVQAYKVNKVFTNRDYEPYAQQRDRKIYDFLKDKNIEFKGFKDQVMFEKNEVLKKDGKPYTVFTPYSKKWKAKLATQTNGFYLKPYPNESYFENFLKSPTLPIPSMEELGFESLKVDFPDSKADEDILKKYGEQRDIPGIRGTSRLGIHLRFGTISIRQLGAQAQQLSDKYFTELIWRDFYQMILYHFPHAEKKAFKPAYDMIPWVNDEKMFQAWCEGKTGYPMVDAGMRELNETGFMHNRVRMITAGFLTKHLLTDWRWGETYFAEKLLDFDLASNNGGWQWAASSGCDAAPYFRVFNPTTQLDKFDKDRVYVKKWIPEYGTDAYPEPIIEHKFARQRAIDTYKAALANWKK